MSATVLSAKSSLTTQNNHRGRQKSLYTRLIAEPALDRPVAAARFALSQLQPEPRCPKYLAALAGALWEEFPPFVTEFYANLQQTASANGQWLVTWLLTTAEHQGHRARKLWSLAYVADNDEERQLLKRHACDESDQVFAYLNLLDLVFPGAIDPDFRSELNQLSPQYSIKQELTSYGIEESNALSTDEYIQINLVKLRATVHNINMRPALKAHCPARNKGRANRVIDSLLRDELNHVAYTAILIERAAHDMEANSFQRLFCRNVSDFNRMMDEEPIEFSYNRRFGNYP